MQSLRNGCGFLMLEKLRQLECAQGFVHLMYNLLEMLGKVMEFMLLSGSVRLRKRPAAASGSHAESSHHAEESIPTQMDLVGCVQHRTYSLSQSSKASISVESVLGVNL